MLTWKDLSYSLPHESHFPIETSLFRQASLSNSCAAHERFRKVKVAASPSHLHNELRNQIAVECFATAFTANSAIFDAFDGSFWPSAAKVIDIHHAGLQLTVGMPSSRWLRPCWAHIQKAQVLCWAFLRTDTNKSMLHQAARTIFRAFGIGYRLCGQTSDFLVGQWRRHVLQGHFKHPIYPAYRNDL